MTLRMMTLAQTFEVVRHENDERMSPPPEVSVVPYSSRTVSTLGMITAYPYVLASRHNTPSAQSPSESESDIDAYGGSRRAAPKKTHRRSVQPTRDITPAHGEVRFSTRKAAKVSNYNEDDDDMFDDEADMVPQGYWVAGPDENVPAIDAVLDHRLRKDTSQQDNGVLTGSETKIPAGKEATDTGRDDYEYYVGITVHYCMAP